MKPSSSAASATPALRRYETSLIFRSLGRAAALMHLAAQFGERFSVLSSDPTPKGLIASPSVPSGSPNSLSPERMAGCSVLDLVRKPDEAFNGILAAARNCVDDGADILVMGCMGMGFTPHLTERLQDRVGVPVVNSVLAGLKIADGRRQFASSPGQDRRCSHGTDRECWREPLLLRAHSAVSRVN